MRRQFAPEKFLSLALSAALVLSGPGFQGWLLFAEVPAAQTVQRVIDPRTNRIYKLERPVVSNIRLLLSRPDILNRLDPEFRQRTFEFLNRAGELAGGSPDLVERLSKLESDLQNLNGRDPGILLTQAFANSAYHAGKAEGGRVHTESLVEDQYERRYRVNNSHIGRTQQDVDIQEIKHGFQRFVVRQPDPKHPGREVIEQVGYQAYERGAEKQKIAYSRTFAEMLRLIIRFFHDRPDIKDLLDDGKVPEKSKEGLRRELKLIQAQFPKELLGYEKELKLLEARIQESPDLNPEELKFEAKRLEGMQARIQAFYNNNQLEMLQKTLLAQFVFYFTMISGTSFNPFDKKDNTGVDLTRMSLNDIQGMLSNFEQGWIPGTGWIPWKASWSDMDSNKHLSFELQMIASEAIQYLNFAADAQRRLYSPENMRKALFKPELTKQDREATLAEMDRWVRLAQLHIQRFEVQSLAVQVWRLKERKLKGELGLSSEDPLMIKQAERMIRTAEAEILPEMRKLEGSSRESLIHETAYAFSTALYRARYASTNLEALEDDVHELLAQARQMRALFQAKQFNIFLYSPEMRAKFSAAQQAQGSLYAQFLGSLSPQAKETLAIFDALLNDLQRLQQKGLSVSQVKDSLYPIQLQLKSLVALLGMSSIPNPEGLKKEADRLKVYQANLGAVVQSFSTNLRLFDMLNELQIYMGMYGSSKWNENEKWYELKQFDRFFNGITGGLRDKAGEETARLMDPEAWEVLKGKEGVRLDAMDLLRKGRFNEVLLKLAELDPRGAETARVRFLRDQQDPELDLDIVSLLSKGPRSPDSAAAVGALNGAFEHLTTYIKGFMIGTAAVDAVAGTFAMAGVGPLIAKAFTVAGRAALGVSRLARLGALGRMAENLGMLQRMIGFAGKLSPGLFPGTFRFAGKILTNVGRNIRVTLGLPANLKEAMVKSLTLRGFANVLLNAGKFQIRNTITMALASAMMSEGIHLWSPETSPFKDSQDAITQGLAGGAGFGAKTGFLLLANPFPTTAFGKTGFGGVMRRLGESNGPLEAWVLNPLARAFTRAPGETAMAKVGFWGSAMQWAENLSGAGLKVGGRQVWGSGLASQALRQAAQWLVFAGSFVDGGLKYFAAAEMSKELATVGGYGWAELLQPERDRGDFAASGHINRLTYAQSWGDGAQQVSWLLLPTQPHVSVENMRDWKESSRALHTLNKQGRLMDVLGKDAALEGRLHVNKPLLQWGVKEFLGFILNRTWGRVRGHPQIGRPKDKLDISPELQAMVVERIWKSLGRQAYRFSIADLIAIRSAREELFNSERSMEEVLAVLGRGDGSTAEEREAVNFLLLPRLRESADQILRKRLGSFWNRGLLKDIVRQVREHEAGSLSGIEVEGTPISNPDVIKDLGDLAAWILIEKAPIGESKWAPRLHAALTPNAPMKQKAILVVDRLAARIAAKNKAAGGSLEAEEIAEMVEREMDDFLKAYSRPGRGNFRWALERHRGSLQGDALDRYNAESFLEDAVSGKYRDVDSPQAQARVERAVALAAAALKTHGIVDAHGNKIAEYKDVQTNIFKDFLRIFQQEGGDVLKALKVYLLAHTGAGKSAISMIMLMPLARAVAKKAGLEGVDYNTHGDLLRAQAQGVYRAYFKGRLPDFRIQSYSDLVLEDLMAIEEGNPSPVETRFQINDEYDQIFLEPPTSLGKDSGKMSWKSPLWEAHRKAVELIDALHAKTRLEGEHFAKELERGGDLAKSFDEVEAQVLGFFRQALKEQKKSRDPELKKERGKFLDLIAHMERYGFSLKGYIRSNLIDFYKTAGIKDPSSVMLKRPQRGGSADPARAGEQPAEKGDGTLAVHGGGTAVYSALDTGGQRIYYDVKENADITNPYENLAMTDAAGLLSRTRYMVALSGTLAEMLRPILERYGVLVRGHWSRSLEGRTVMGKDRRESLELMTSYAHGNAAGGGRNLSMILIKTNGDADAVEKLLVERYGVRPETIVRHRVGDTFKAENLFMGEEVRRDKNEAALEDGTARYVLLTVGASRGLDMLLKTYDRVNLYILGKENMSLSGYIQGKGRPHLDRLAPAAFSDVYEFTDAQSLSEYRTYRETSRWLLGLASEGQGPELAASMAAKIREEWLSAGKYSKGALDKISDEAVVRRYLGETRETVAEGLREQWAKEEPARAAEIAAMPAERITREFLDIVVARAKAEHVEGMEKRLSEQLRKGQLTPEEAARKRADIELVRAELNTMPHDEALQWALENPYSISNPKVLNAAREMVLARRLSQAFQDELARAQAGDPSALESLLSDSRLYDMVASQVQRQVELSDLTGSGIMRVERILEPEDIQALMIGAISLVSGAGMVWTLAHIPSYFAFLQGWLPWLGGINMMAPWNGALALAAKVSPSLAAGFAQYAPYSVPPLTMMTAWLFGYRRSAMGQLAPEPKPFYKGGQAKAEPPPDDGSEKPK
ncbi:MAG: hypothetical protein HY921_09345 [Elusimicrobia bacterium]|nr:hypothetical protein [Elusimicrobiota bacterium]